MSLQHILKAPKLLLYALRAIGVDLNRVSKVLGTKIIKYLGSCEALFFRHLWTFRAVYKVQKNID